VIVGVDEQTGLIDEGMEGEWTVFGKGMATVYKSEKPKAYRSGETFFL
jgi:hypothetical protein